MRNVAIVVATLSLGLLRGQDKAPAESLESAIIHVKTLDGDSFDRLVRLLKVFGTQTEADDHLRTILVYGRPEVIAQMRHVVEELDRPGSEAAIGRNIEMTLTFLRTSTRASANPQPLPPDIEAAAKQLRAVTQYKEVQIWEVLPLHLQEGKETTESLRLPRTEQGDAPVPPRPATASIRIYPDSIYQKDKIRYVRFRNMHIDISMPYLTGTPGAGQWNFYDSNLGTTGDFAEGQKTIVGKLSGMDEGSAIFIVVTLKILD